VIQTEECNRDAAPCKNSRVHNAADFATFQDITISSDIHLGDYVWAGSPGFDSQQ